MKPRFRAEWVVVRDELLILELVTLGHLYRFGPLAPGIAGAADG